MKLFNQNLIYIISLIIFIIFITILSTNYHTYEFLTNSSDNKKEEPICPGPIELPCNPGPQGERGPAGGEFQEKGPLRNLSMLEKVVDTTNILGNSEFYITSFLNDRTYKPEQTWTLNSSTGDFANRIKNQSGNCITVDNKDFVGISTCDKAVEWEYTSQGQLKPKSNSGKETKCLTYTNAGTVKTLKKKDQLGNTKGKSLDMDQSVYKLSMAKCGDKSNPPLKQQWSFN